MSKPKPVKKRTRSGCLTCRDRHMKCDEQLPVCNNCIKSQRKCYRGVRLNFIQYSFYDPKNDLRPPIVENILDQSITIAKLYNGKKYYRPYLNLHTKEELRQADEIYKMDCDQGKFNQTHDYMSRSQSFMPEPIRGIPGNQRTFTPMNHMPSDSNSDGHILGVNEQPDPRNEKIHENNSDHIGTSIKEEFNLQMSRPETSIESPFFNDDLISGFQIPDLSSSFNIQNFLLKPKYEFEPPNLSSSKIIFDNPNFEFDIEKFIKLIEFDQYYWLLDLFNGLGVWKSVIPSYALQLINENENGNYSRTFLINCLLCCSADDVSYDKGKFRNNLDLQLEYFNIIKNSPIDQDTKLLEIVLISVVLILLKVLNRLVFKLDFQDFYVVYNNQLRIFNKLSSNLSQISGTRLKKIKSVVLVSSIHSIVILKYLINKNLQISIGQKKSNGLNYSQSPHFGQTPHVKLEQQSPDVIDNSRFQPPPDDNNYDANNRYSGLRSEEQDSSFWEKQLNDPIDYDHEEYSTHDSLNRFELENLSNEFSNFEISQPLDNSQSTAFKLRRLVWWLVKADYMKRYPDSTTFDLSFDSQYSQVKGISSNVVFTNDRQTLLVLFSQYLSNLRDNENLLFEDELSPELKTITEVFEIVNDSMISRGQKRSWASYFHWMLL